MMKFENVYVIEALYSILLQNTKFYRRDFRYDVEKICSGCESKDYEDKRFIWLSRHCGTYCFKEEDVICQHTFASAALDYYMDDPNVLLYAIEITEYNEEKIIGNLYQLDYQWYYEQIKGYRDIQDCENKNILCKLRMQKEYEGQSKGMFSEHLESLYLKCLNKETGRKFKSISGNLPLQNHLEHCVVVHISKQVRSFMESRKKICIFRFPKGIVLKLSKGESTLGISISDKNGTGSYLYDYIKDSEMIISEAYICTGLIQSIMETIGRVLDTKNHGDIFCV